MSRIRRDQQDRFTHFGQLNSQRTRRGGFTWNLLEQKKKKHSIGITITYQHHPFHQQRSSEVMVDREYSEE